MYYYEYFTLVCIVDVVFVNWALVFLWGLLCNRKCALLSSGLDHGGKSFQLIFAISVKWWSNKLISTSPKHKIPLMLSILNLLNAKWNGRLYVTAQNTPQKIFVCCLCGYLFHDSVVVVIGYCLCTTSETLFNTWEWDRCIEFKAFFYNR